MGVGTRSGRGTRGRGGGAATGRILRRLFVRTVALASEGGKKGQLGWAEVVEVEVQRHRVEVAVAMVKVVEVLKRVKRV